MIDTYCRIDKREYGYVLPASGLYLIVVILIASVFRVLACMNTPVINSDGISYLWQAKAIHYGQWKLLTSCNPGYVSNYPILIAAAYYIVQDWIVTGRIISCIFGIAAIIPLWLTARRFFEERISILLTLIFAVTPMFAGSSADIVPDTIFCFFILFGIYFFIAGTDRTSVVFFPLACLSFIMAAWAETEALLFPIISVIYLGYIEEKKTKKILMFLSPILVIIAIIAGIAIFSEYGVNQFDRVIEILEKITEPSAQYHEFREALKEISSDYHNQQLEFFLTQARKNIWLIALSSLIAQMPEAFFYLFFPICIIGMTGLRERIAEEPLLIYFIMLIISAFLLLYVHTLCRWITDHRFFAILILPNMIFTGFGLEKILNLFALRFPDKDTLIFVIVALLMILITLPENLKSRDKDKLIFKDIGEYIALRETDRKKIPISASAHTQQQVSFYADLSNNSFVCPEALPGYCWEFFPNDYDGFVNHLHKNHIDYMLWVEKHWSKQRFDFFKSPYRRDFRELKRWKHDETGNMILYRVIR